MSQPGRTRAGRAIRLAAGALLSVGLVFWAWQLRVDEARGESTDATDSVGASEAPAPRRPSLSPRLRTSVSPAPSAQSELGSDGVPIMAAKGDSTDYGPRHPHPITPEHQRISRENALLGSLNGAMDVEDIEELRRLNERYRADYPEDAHRLQAGYDIIADCLEQRSPENRDRAERYFDEERASTLRRYVRRYCLQ